MAKVNPCGVCFGGAGNVILQGMAGRGLGLVVGISRLQIEIQNKTLAGGGSVSGIIPQPIIHDIPRDSHDNNKVEVYISIKWPFMSEWSRKMFIMERKWANVLVNRIKQINTFNEKFIVKYSELTGTFKVKYGDLTNNFKVKFGDKWKK